MRHRLGGRKLHRTTSHRLAMLDNLVTSLLEHEAVKTTVPKAKEARRLAERVITLGKRGGLANVRLAERHVRNRAILQKVFSDLKTRYATRPGGYTRIIRLGFRTGDAAPMALLELVDRPAKPEGGEVEAEPKAKVEAKAEKPAKAPKAPKAEKAEAKAEPAAEKKAAKAKEPKAEKSESAEKKAPAKKKPAKKSE